MYGLERIDSGSVTVVARMGGLSPVARLMGPGTCGGTVTRCVSFVQGARGMVDRWVVA